MQSNATQHIKHAALLFTFANNKIKNMPRSSNISPQNFIIMLHDYKCLCELLLFTTTAFILRCDATQRNETVVLVTCIMHALATTFRIFFLFRLILSARLNKEQLGQQSQTFVFISRYSLVSLVYSLVPFRLQQCSARDAYCAICPYHLARRNFSVHCNQRYFVEL